MVEPMGSYLVERQAVKLAEMMVEMMAFSTAVSKVVLWVVSRVEMKVVGMAGKRDRILVVWMEILMVV